MFGYSLVRMANSRPFFNAMLDELGAFGVPIEGLHTETGPGVFEAAIQAADALEAADRGVLFKTSVKEIGQRFQVMPTFMAKWNTALPGCSGHMHQSLWTKNGNAFDDDKDPRRMSKVFKSYLAGQLRGLADLLPFFAPTVNSYKRPRGRVLGPDQGDLGHRQPYRGLPRDPRRPQVHARRGARLRLRHQPLPGPGRVHRGRPLGHRPGLEARRCARRGQRLHGREGGAAAAHAAGGDPRLSESKLAREILGEEFVDHYVRTREWEWRQFQDAVTDWELRRYFEVI
jgi:glutamine synthetase